MIIDDLLELIDKFDSSVTAEIIFGGYNASYKAMRRKLSHNATWQSKEQIQRARLRGQRKLNNKERQNFYNLLSYLRRKGFIEKKKHKSGKILWRLTSIGLERLQNIKNKIPLSPFKKKLTAEIDYLKIIIFDIPETDRKKRNWLRTSLINLNFKMLQKSVWMGKNKLPEEFIFKLREFKIMPYIHIFAINEKGTIDFGAK